jgi:hypothetical protein
VQANHLESQSKRKKSRTKRIVIIGFLLGIAALAIDYFFLGFVVGLFHNPSDAFGRHNWSIMEGADRIEVIRIEFPKDIQTSQPYLGGSLARAIVPDDAWVGRLRELVGTSRYYTWDWRKRCLPVPGVAVRFWKGDEGVEILFCFQCDLVILSPIGKQELDKWKIFERGRKPALKLMKEIFPNDTVIQNLN